MTAENLSITWTTVLALLAGIIVIMNFIDKIKAWKKPDQDKDKMIKETLDEHQRLLKKDNERLAQVEDGLEISIKAQLAIMDHLITGNSTDRLKSVRTEVQDYLISRKIMK